MRAILKNAILDLNIFLLLLEICFI